MGRPARRRLVGALCAAAAVCLGAAGASAQTAQFSYAQSTIVSGLSGLGVAVDGSGNVYIADFTNNRVLKETLSGSGYTQSTIGSGLNYPLGVAVDGSGNVYIADTVNNRVLKETLSGTTYRQSTVLTGLSSPIGVAVDGSGNVYIADSGNSQVLKETPSGSGYTQSIVVNSGLNDPVGISVDGGGNVYIADRLNNRVLKETLSGGTYTQSIVADSATNGLNGPEGVAVDSSGNVYIADTGNNQVLKEAPNGGGGYTQSTLLGTGLSYPEGVAADGSGNVYIADSNNNRVLKLQTAGVNFYSEAVGSKSAAQTLTFTFDGAGSGVSVKVLTEGVSGLDFADAGTGTCTTNGTSYSYSLGSTCTVDVTFAPKYAGLREGAVELTNSSGTAIATAYIYGTGTGPQVAFGPPVQSIITNSLSIPYAVAVDESGNVYIADYGNSRVLKETLSGGSYTPSTIGSGLSGPAGVAVDGAGNVYIADYAKSRVLKETLNGGSYTQSTIGSGLIEPFAVAVDGNDNVYIGDVRTRLVLKETLNGGSYTQSIVTTSGLGAPVGVAVDSSGNVYIADLSNNLVLKETLNGGSYTQSIVADSATNGLSGPNGVAVDSSGNVYIADTHNNRVLKEDSADPPSLSFATSTAVGSLDSTDGTQTVQIENIGNASLSLTTPATGTNPSYPANFPEDSSGSTLCASGTPLLANASCNVAVQFQPIAAGTNSGDVVLTDNNLNATNATQSIGVSGTGIGIPTQLAFTTAPPENILAGGNAGSAVTVAEEDLSGNIVTTAAGSIALTVTGPNGYSQTYNGTVSSGVATFNLSSDALTTAGSYTYKASLSALTSAMASETVVASSLNLGSSQNVGTSTAAQTVTVYIATSGTLGAIGVLTQGAPNLDFTQGSGGTCAIGTSYSAGQTCTVSVIFAPKYPGLREGAVVLTSSSGSAIATAYLSGTGTGPQVAFGPPVQSTITNSLSYPYAVAVDGSGNVYIADYGNNRVLKETLSGGSYTPSTIGSGLRGPTGVAVDGAGNVYISDGSNYRVLKETLSGGSYTQSIVADSATNGLGRPFGVAVDGSGNVYIADYGNNRVLKETLSGGSYAQSTIGSGLSRPEGVAVDGSGNVYIADTDNNRVLKETLNGGSYTQSPIGSGLVHPEEVAVDGSGNVYIADSGNNRVLKETLDGGSYTQSIVADSATNGLSGPDGVAVDGSGNVYIADISNNRVLKEDYADAPSLSFATSTVVGALDSTDGTQTVQIENIGNASLTLTTPATGTNPGYPANFPENSSGSTLCASGTPLLAGASCNIAVQFQPTAAGTNSGDVVLTDNNLNATNATQSISVIGTGVAGPATAFSISPLPSSAYVGGSVSVTVTACDSHGDIATGYTGTVAFTSTDSNATLPANYAFTAGDAGVHTFTVKFGTVGNQTVTATDTVSSSIAATSGTVAVSIPGYGVNTTADDATGVASHCTSLPEGACTLRDALAAASAAGSGNITFDPGVFASTNTTAENTITLGTAEVLFLPSNTTIQGLTSGSGATLANLVTVSGNYATSVFTTFFSGAGSTNVTLANLNIVDGSANANQVPDGSGIFNGGGTLRVTQCSFSGDSSLYNGGAIASESNAVLTVTDSTFSGNSAVSVGGAIYNENGSTATVTGSTFSGNSAYAGGAIGHKSQGALTVTNSTFSGNSATGVGGAIYESVAPTTATLSNNIFSGNTAPASGGAGIYSVGGTNVVNASDNVYYRNLDGGTTEDDCNGCTTNTNAVSGDPMLTVLDNYGGPTETMLPQPGSAAICAGLASLVPSGTTADQRGVAFNAGGYCASGSVDAGAVQTDYALSWSGSGSVQPSNVVQDAAMSPAPAVTLEEDGNAFTATAETIPLTLTGSGTLTGDSAVTSAGVATYSSLSVNAPGTGDSLTATLALNPAIATHAPSIAATSGSFTVTSAVTQLAFSAAPAATLTAGSNGGTVKVAEESSTGSVVTTSADTIVLTVTGPNSYSKTYTAAAVAGVATFDVSGAALDAAGGYTYTATSGSYTQAVASETVNAGAASTVSVVAGNNQSTTIGTAFAAALEVKVEDAHSNPVQGATVSFSAPASGAGATFSTPAPTDASGETSVTATANGQASTTAYTVTASVSGAATSAAFLLTNTQRATTLTVTPTATALVYGQPVTVNAAIAPSSVSGSAPTGKTAFNDGTTALTPNATVSGAEASYTVSVPTVGTHTYAATYLGDTNFSASAKTSATAAVVVSQAASTLTGPATPIALTYGKGGSISVSVDGQYSGSGIAQPTGTVSYTIGGGAAQTAAISAGAATLTVPTSEVAGTYTVTVSYAGDGNYKAATSLVVDLTINKAAATVTLGDLTQTYTGSPLAATAATNPKNLTVNLTYDGSAAAPAAAGTYAVTATVTDTTYTGSASGTLTIEKAAAVLSVASSPASPVYRGLVTLTGRISPAVAAPASAFSFHIDSGTASSAVVPAATYSAGTVTASYGQLKAGAHTVSLSFSGSSNYQPGASGTAAIAVAQAAPSIAWAPVASITYGEDLAALLDASASYSGSAVPGTFSYTAQAAGGAAVPVTGTTVLAAGSYTLATAFTPTDAVDYKAQSQTSPLTVSEATLKAMADDATRVYGAANPAFIGAVTGAVNGDSFTESFTTAASAASSPGAYAIVPAVSGADLGDYTLTSANGTLTVTKAATSIALASGSTSITPGESVTLTATIADASSGSTGTPTGTVSFYDGTALLGTKTLSGGAAVYTTTSLAAAATHALMAVYSGDGNFTGSSTSTVVDVVVAPLNFTMTLASPGTLTIPPGGTASYQVKVTPTYGSYAGTVRFQASGLPAGATASFSPASIPANGGPQTVTVTISMPATVAAIHRPSAGSRLAPVAFAVLLLPFAGGLRRRGRKLSRLICVLLLTVSGAAAIAGLTGCGEHNGYFAQPQKSYTVTMTATAGSLQRTAVVTVDVE